MVDAAREPDVTWRVRFALGSERERSLSDRIFIDKLETFTREQRQ
jgi:hypothetical protein